MFVFKEAPLHPELTAEIMKHSPVRKLGLVTWPYHREPDISGIEIHHIYAPFPHLTEKAANLDCVYISSLFSLRSLARTCDRHRPQLRLCLEVGDGRDGAMPEELPALCEEACRCGFSLRGLAVNFACLSREAPSLERLLSAENELENLKKFFLPDADISAGGTDVLELAAASTLPGSIGEIRCGTGVTLGRYPLSGLAVPQARQDTFRLETHVLECRVKNGHRMALLDTGTFHTDPAGLIPPLPGMIFAGTSSAYTSFDVTGCPEFLQEGTVLSFGLDYHALSRALTSQALPVLMEKA